MSARGVQSTFTGASLPFIMIMRILLLLALAALGAAGPPARAQARDPNAIALSAAMTMDQAVRMAEQRFKARVVRAESQQYDGRTIYILRLLNESGRVWTVRVDASSGSLL